MYIKPNYDESIVSVANSILKEFDINHDNNTLKIIDDEFKKNKYKNIVLVLYDGLGYNILENNKEICPFLYSNIKGKISSVFPPTTTAATTSVITGLEPKSHGWLGWDMYFKDYGVITLFLDKSKITKKKIGNYPGSFKLLHCETIMDKISKKEGCASFYVSPFGNVKYKSYNLKEFNKKIIESCNNDKKNYVYAYFENPDAIFHKCGVDSKRAKKTLKSIDSSFKELTESLDDTLFILIADHGHLNTTTITLSDYSNLYNMLDNTTSLDSRTVSFMVKDEYKNCFKEEIKEILKDDFILLTHDEIIEENYFGSKDKNKYFDDAIGDFVAIGIGNKTIRYDKKDMVFKSNHSGITEDEVYVPLIMVRRK